MTDAERAYHHALQYWWKRALAAEAALKERTSQPLGVRLAIPKALKQKDSG